MPASMPSFFHGRLQAFAAAVLLLVGLLAAPSAAAADISGITVVQPGGNYAAGTLTVRVAFAQAVDVDTSGGTPTIALSSGGTAIYSGGTATNATSLDFAYTIAGGDATAVLATTANPPISLSGGTITLASDGTTAADLARSAGAVLSQADGLGIAINHRQTVTAVAVTDAGQNYASGQTVHLRATFSGAVTVTGTPTLALDAGSANYTGGSGTTQLTFAYVVGSSDASSGLHAASAAPFALPNGATVVNVDNAAVPADLGFAAFATPLTSTANAQPTTINVTVPETITSVKVVQAGGTYATNQTLDIQVTFSGIVDVNTAGGTHIPSLALSSGGTATYTGGSGSNVLTFRYVILTGQTSASLGYGANPIALNSATIANRSNSSVSASLALASGTLLSAADGQPFVITSPAPRTIASVAVSQANGNYTSGQALTITVAFTGAVDVVGTPTLALNSSGSASYVSGSGSSNLVFSYVIGAADTIAVLDYASTTPIALPSGAAIRNGGTLIAATLTCPALASASSISGTRTISINASQRTISSIAIVQAGGNYVTGSALSLRVTFSGAVTVTGTPTIALTSGGTATYASGSGTSALLFSYTVAAGHTATALNVSANPPIALAGGSISSASVAANLAFASAGLLGSDSQPVSVNLPPRAYLGGAGVADIPTGTLTFPPLSAPFETRLAPNAVVSPSAASIDRLTVRLVDHPDGVAETLGFATGTTLTAAPFNQITISPFANLTGTLTISTGTAATPGQVLTGADYTTILRAIVYRHATPTGATPGDRRVEFTMTDRDARSAAASTATLTVGSGLPVVMLSGNLGAPDTSLQYAEGSGARTFGTAAVVSNPTPSWTPDYGTTPWNPFELYVMVGPTNVSYYEGSVLDQITITMTNPDGTGIFPNDGSNPESVSLTLPPAYSYGSGPSGNFLGYTTEFVNPYPMYSIRRSAPAFAVSSGTTTGQTITVDAGQSGAQLAQPIFSGSPGRFPIPTFTVENIIRSLTYANTSANPTKYGNHRLITVSVLNRSTVGSPVTSVTSSCLVTLVPTNEAPVLTAPGTAFATISEGAASVALAGIGIGDADGNGADETLTVGVSHGSLRMTAVSGLTAISANPAASITLTGPLNGSTGALAQALASLAYTPDALYNGADSLVLHLVDNGHSSGNPSLPANILTADLTLPLTISATNQPPVLTVPGSQSGSENADLVITQPMTVSDPDLTSAGTVQVTLHAGHGALSLAGTTGLNFAFAADAYGTAVGSGSGNADMRFRGSLANAATALAQVTYRGDLNYYGSDAITVAISDLGQTGPWDATAVDAVRAHGPGTSWVVTRSIPLAIAFANHVPDIAANTALVVPAGDARTLVGGTYVAPSYPLLGVPLNANQAAIAPVGAGTAPTSSSNLVARDIETVDASGLTFTIILAPTQGVLQRGGATIAAGASFTQRELNLGSISYAHNGAILGDDSFVFTCSDDNHLSHPAGAADAARGVNSDLTTNIFTIHIDRTKPTISLVALTPVFAEATGTPVPIVAPTTAVHNEAAPGAFVIGGAGSGSLVVALAIPTPAPPAPGYPAYTDGQDLLGIHPPLGGAISATLISAAGVQPAVYSVTYTSGTTIPVGTVTIAAGGQTLTATFASTSNIPVDAVTTLLRAVTFSNPSPNPSTAQRSATVVVTNGAGLSSLPATIPIDVLPSNDPPAIAAPAVPAGLTVPRVTVSGPVGATDADSILTYAVSTQPGKGTVTVAGNVWTYTAFAGSSGTDSFAITAGDLGIPSDATPSTAPATRVFQIGITPVDATATPLITSNAPMEIEEGGNLTYAPTVSAGSALSFQLIGLATSATVQFDASNGTLTWIGVPLPAGGYYDFGILVADPVAGVSSFQPILLKVFAAGSRTN